MHDYSITCRHWVENVMKSEARVLQGLPSSDGRWRLTDHVVDYSMPWKELSRAAIFREYKQFECPWKSYMHHLINKYEGEVAEAWGDWLWTAEPLPRHAELWDQQFASGVRNYEELGKLQFKWDGCGKLMVHPDCDLTKVGDTKILRSREGFNGHWHLYGFGITLADLFFKFGKHYTVVELMNWYYRANKICQKKGHPWGSAHEERSAI